jgi:hypothetical protein
MHERKYKRYYNLQNLFRTIFNTVNVDLGTTTTNPHLIQEEIKRRLNSGNACYHSVQNILSSRLLSKNIKIRIYKTIIFLMVLHGCETWSLTVREELRRIFGPKRD